MLSLWHSITTVEGNGKLEHVILRLWIHGTCGCIEKPCSVDVVGFSGGYAHIDFINSVMLGVNCSNDDKHSIELLETVKGLPTQTWLEVSVNPIEEDDGFSFEVVNYTETI